MSSHILQRPGPFTTPRAVYKTIRFSLRGKAQEHAASLMKTLSDEGTGVYLTFGRNESVYFKPTPEEDNKEKVEPLVGSWEDYKENFTKRDEVITTSQYNKLVAKAPHVDELVDNYINTTFHAACKPVTTMLTLVLCVSLSSLDMLPA